MKVNLSGLIRNVQGELKDHMKCGSTYAGMHAYSLGELEKHIIQLINGQVTKEEFAEFYCIDANHYIET